MIEGAINGMDRQTDRQTDLINKIRQVKFFSITDDETHKIIHLCGLKLKMKNSKKKLNKIINIAIKDAFNNVTEEYLHKHNQYYVSSTRALHELFIKYLEKNDINKEYTDLISNLDDKSIKLVSRALNVLERCGKNSGFATCYVSDEEKIQREEVKQLKEHVVRLNDNAYMLDKYTLPVNEFHPEVFYSEYGLDECSNIDRTKCIIDAGAWIGDSSLVLAKYTDDKVYAFEPFKSSYDLLNKTAELNKLQDKIIPVNKGISNVDDKITINIAARPNNCTLINYDVVDNTTMTISQEKIDVTSIDNFVKEHNLSVGVIKSDIEGAEPLLLEGARETISTQRPVLIISIYHTPEDFFKIKPMLESWNLDYTFKIRKLHPNCFITDLVLICEPKNNN